MYFIMYTVYKCKSYPIPVFIFFKYKGGRPRPSHKIDKNAVLPNFVFKLLFHTMTIAFCEHLNVWFTKYNSVKTII